jgi:hypothetical protein
VLLFVLSVILFSLFKEKVKVEKEDLEPPGKQAVLKAFINNRNELIERRKLDMRKSMISDSCSKKSFSDKKLIDLPSKSVEQLDISHNNSFLSFNKDEDA